MNKRLLATVGATAILGGVLSACSGTSESGGGASSADAGPLTVWVDAARVPAVEAFQKAHPEVKIEVNNISNTGGSSGLKQQFALFNQAKEGWPDVIFFGGIDDIAWAASSEIDYAKQLEGVIDQSVLDGYTKAAQAPCTQGKGTVCLRNDQAQDVLWYNKKLFDQWGYTVPTTWAQYEDLSLKIATEHPGYYTGLVGDALSTNRYLWASGCPTNELIEGKKIRIATGDAKCTRVVNMLDKLISAGVVSAGGAFDSDVATKVGPKLVMNQAATWWGAYMFRDTFKVPAGEMAVAPPLTWDGEAGTGNEGGGLWVMSSHIADAKVEAAKTVMQFMVSDPAYAVEIGPTFPAYGGVQQAWLDKQAKDGYVANPADMATVFIDAGKVVRPYSLLQYNTGDIWTQTVVPELLKKTPLSKAWNTFSDHLVNEAKTLGYEVTTN
ncbi:MAG: ABC transporter substrate-binding protein [Nostocoides sp.]